jgi:transposase
VVDEQPGIKHVGCWSHARRKFIDARGGPKAPPGGLADEALKQIKKLFVIEKNLREKDLEDDEFIKQRRKYVEPILKKLKDWVDKYIYILRFNLRQCFLKRCVTCLMNGTS